MPYLYIDPLQCTGCRVCELTCSFVKAKVFSPLKSRVKVIRLEPGLDFPIACRHCLDAPCVKACPTGALYKENGITKITPSKCIGCNYCTDACPFGAINVDPDLKVAVFCDLCGACVKMCPVQALKIVEGYEEANIKKANVVKSKILPHYKQRILKGELVELKP